VGTVARIPPWRKKADRRAGEPTTTRRRPDSDARSFATCADAVRDGVDDFLLYWIDSNKAFVTNNVAPDPAPPTDPKPVTARADS